MCFEVPPKRWQREFEYLFAIFNSLLLLLEKHSRIFDIKIELKLWAFLHVHCLIARRTVVVVFFGDVKLLGNFSCNQTFLSNLLREDQGQLYLPNKFSRNTLDLHRCPSNRRHNIWVDSTGRSARKLLATICSGCACRCWSLRLCTRRETFSRCWRRTKIFLVLKDCFLEPAWLSRKSLTVDDVAIL